jgi:hypothetical protein
MKMYETVEVYLHAFLALALGGGWSASCPGCFTPLEAAADERYDDLRAIWAQWEREKSLIHQEPNPDSSAVQTVY